MLMLCTKDLTAKLLSLLVRKDIVCCVCLFSSLVRSHLEYSSIIWSLFFNCHIDIIEAIQRQFLQNICSKFGMQRKLDMLQASLKYFKIMPLQSMRVLLEYPTLFNIRKFSDGLM